MADKITDNATDGNPAKAADKRPFNYKRWRRVTVGAVLVIAAIGFIWHTGTGTLSAIGWKDIYLLCPLGALEALLGGWAFVPRVALAFAAVVLIVIVGGRAFCAWVCPVPPLNRFFKTKKVKAQDAAERAEAGRFARDNYVQGKAVKRGAGLDSRHIVLCGALGSAAIFGFPVFCLICPVGLAFAVMIGLVRLVGFNEPSWSLVLFIAILVIELVFLSKWCAKLCPMGALISLISKANKTFRPSIDSQKCLRSTASEACGACATACPEHIDPHSDLGYAALAECTRCGACAHTCPTQAISFRLLRESGEGNMLKPE